MAKIINMRNNDPKATVRSVIGRLESDLKAEYVWENFSADGASGTVCFEKYYFRNNSAAALTVFVTGSTVSQQASVIGFGAGTGPFNMDLGADGDFADLAADILKTYGFAVLSEHDD